MAAEQKKKHLNITHFLCIYTFSMALVIGIIIYLWNSMTGEGMETANSIGSLFLLWIALTAVMMCSVTILVARIRRSFYDAVTDLQNENNKAADQYLRDPDSANVMNELLYKDSLTGIRNRLAYDCELQRIGWGVSSGSAEFGIAVVDLDNLKQINDSYGHEKGNLAIINLGNLVCECFAHSAVFRTGNAEFTVILEKQEYGKSEELIRGFKKRIEDSRAEENQMPWNALSASVGFSKFDPTTDKNVREVFARAKKNVKTSI